MKYILYTPVYYAQIPKFSTCYECFVLHENTFLQGVEKWKYFYMLQILRGHWCMDRHSNMSTFCETFGWYNCF